MTNEEKFEERVVAFLYELGRDHLPLADIEQLARNSEGQFGIVTKYSNKGLEIYAREIVERLKKEMP